MLKQKWPVYDEVTIVIQVNGKLRDQFQVSADLAKNKAELEKIALEQIQSRLDGKTVRKVIVVPGRLVNVVV